MMKILHEVYCGLTIFNSLMKLSKYEKAPETKSEIIVSGAVGY